MKKNQLTIGVLLFAMNCIGQSDALTYSVQSDTICEMVRGKCNYMFDYNTSKRLVEYDTCRNNHTNSKYYLNEDDFLVLHLYDKNKVMPWFVRKITVFKRNNAIHYFKTHSGSKVFHFSGKDVKSVLVSKPIL